MVKHQQSQLTTMSKIAVILGSQRTGTTALGTALSAAPSSSYAGEIFHDVRGQKDSTQFTKYINNPLANFFTFKENLIRKSPHLIYPSPDNQRSIWTSYLNNLTEISNTRWIIGIKYNSLHHLNPIWQHPLDWPGILTFLHEDEVPIIHLTRNDIFAQAVSQHIANSTGLFHSDKTSDQTMVTIPPDLIKRDMEKIYYNRQHINNVVEFYDKKLDLVYEETFKDERVDPDVCNRVSQLLRLKDLSPGYTGLRKIVRRPLKEVILNRSDIITAFKGHHLLPLVEKGLG